eukprot:gnl/Chilomastix_caulleri/2052.p5 GENE.gnl/Chilomastix_caulleri/2052~~gnl/Chilomastix_caulleri/2052.p5  ORF type:complete len:63 (-),score=25.33 gnl/Chilomastix_caulleri/2052:522-710(-)
MTLCPDTISEIDDGGSGWMLARCRVHVDPMISPTEWVHDLITPRDNIGDNSCWLGMSVCVDD